MTPYRVPAWLRRLAPGYIWQLPPDGDSLPSGMRPIYLTFDDGPMPGPTDRVADILERFNARATFFCVGANVERHPGLAKDLIRAGHRLENHTYHHVSGWATPTRDYLSDAAQADAALAAIGGGEGRWFRPPYGRITPAQGRALRAQGYGIAMWSLLAGDYLDSRTGTQCLEGLAPHLAPGQIITLHDSYKAWPRVEVLLPALLRVLPYEGLVACPLPPNAAVTTTTGA